MLFRNTRIIVWKRRKPILIIVIACKLQIELCCFFINIHHWSQVSFQGFFVRQLILFISFKKIVPYLYPFAVIDNSLSSPKSGIANRNTDFCIPPKSNAVDPWFCDWSLYKERHLVECFFNKLKENRRIATRFDKLASRFLTFVHLGCIRVLLA